MRDAFEYVIQADVAVLSSPCIRSMDHPRTHCAFRCLENILQVCPAVVFAYMVARCTEYSLGVHARSFIRVVSESIFHPRPSLADVQDC